MAFSRTWDETDPADADEAKYGAKEIRELKIDIRERLEAMGIEFNNDPIGQVFLGYIRGLEVSYKDDDEIYISSGAIHVNDGTYDHILSCTSQLTKSVAGHGQTSVPLYFYVDAPDPIAALVAADIEWKADAPVYNQTLGGWYHSVTTDLRFIGSIPVDGDGNLIKGYRSGAGHHYEFDTQQELKTNFQTAAWTDIENIEKFMPHIVDALAYMNVYFDADAASFRMLYARTNGSASNGIIVARVEPNGLSSETFCMRVDAGGKLEWTVSDAAAEAAAFLQGYWEPR